MLKYTKKLQILKFLKLTSSWNPTTIAAKLKYIKPTLDFTLEFEK